MLKQRILTAIVLLTLVVLLLVGAQLHFYAGAIAVVVYLIALEWALVAGYQRKLAHTAYALSITLVNLAIWYTAGDFIVWPSPSWPFELVWDSPMIALAAAVVAIVIAVLIVIGYSKMPRWWANQLIVSCLGFALLPALFVALVAIRATAYLEDFLYGGSLVLFMFLLIWAADTGAYFSGKAFGKTKLAPNVSPNKTWEGACGGFILSCLVGVGGAHVIGLSVTDWGLYLAVIAVLAVLSVYGDLFESALKRATNIKDSGNLLPGHGGVLDRLDSTIIVAPAFYLSFSYYGWF